MSCSSGSSLQIGRMFATTLLRSSLCNPYTKRRRCTTSKIPLKESGKGVKASCTTKLIPLLVSGNLASERSNPTKQLSEGLGIVSRSSLNHTPVPVPTSAIATGRSSNVMQGCSSSPLHQAWVSRWCCESRRTDSVASWASRYAGALGPILDSVEINRISSHSYRTDRNL